MVSDNAAFVGSSIDDLLAVELASDLSKQARWQLISHLERKITMMEGFRDEAIPGSIGHRIIVEKIVALRRKWLEVWNSFYPQFNGRIHFGVHE